MDVQAVTRARVVVPPVLGIDLMAAVAQVVVIADPVAVVRHVQETAPVVGVAPVVGAVVVVGDPADQPSRAVRRAAAIAANHAMIARVEKHDRNLKNARQN